LKIFDIILPKNGVILMDILLIAQNSHQYRYFLNLKNNLPFIIEVVKPIHLCYKNYMDLKKILELKKREIFYKYPKLKANLYFQYIKFITPFFEENYRYLIKKYNPKMVGFWNGVKYPQNIGVEIAKSLNKKTIFFENGFLPNTTQVDFKGVNNLNSVPREKEFYKNLNYNNLALPQTLIPREFEGKQKITDTKLPEKYIFVPFQVGYDSQIIYFSNFTSMRELFYLIKEISKKTNLNFVFKEHPSDKKNNYSDLYKQTDSKLMFANNISTQELIQKADSIITINSSVGIESLLFNKKVFVLGDSFYRIEGVTIPSSKKKLLNDLTQNRKIDLTIIKNFLYYLYYDYLVIDSWKNPTQTHFKQIEKKIKGIL
jgi:capsular polysaccharide export protein